MTLGSQSFLHGGIYILRYKDLYMAVDCGRNGLNDWGGHAHNDTLSFELCVGRTTFIVDPGTFAYTGSHKWHKVFRSTVFHNTIMVDGEELNRFKPHDFWGLCNDAISQINDWQSGQDIDLLDAEHKGYLRLEDPVIHRRQILFHKASPAFWIIRDILSGQGVHTFEFFIHLGDVSLQLLPSLAVGLYSEVAPDERLVVVPMEKDTLSISDSWRAPGYGKKVQSKVLCYKKVGPVPVEFITVFYPVPVGESFVQATGQARAAIQIAQGVLEGSPLE